MNQNHLKKRQRTEDILSSLDKLDYLTRSQLQNMHDLGGERNANRVMRDLDGYVLHFRNGMEKVYYLGEKGREYIGATKIRQRTRNVDHYLLRNQLYIYLNQPTTWRNEVKITFGNLSIVPDAMFNDGSQDIFVEIDVHQTLKENASKVSRYRKLSDVSGKRFMVIFVTTLESRREKFKRLCDGFSYRIYTSNELR